MAGVIMNQFKKTLIDKPSLLGEITSLIGNFNRIKKKETILKRKITKGIN